MSEPILTGWDVYWITRCDAVSTAAGGVAVAVGIALVVLFMVGPMLALDFDDFPWKRIISVLVALGALAVAVKTATPTTKEMCAIIALPAIANNEDVQGLGSEVVVLAREWVQELRPETAK